MHPPLLDMVAVVGNTMSSVLRTKINRNKKIVNTFTNDDHCISAAVNFLTVTPATTVNTLKCRFPN